MTQLVAPADVAGDRERHLADARFAVLLGPLRLLLDDPAVLNVDVGEGDEGPIWVERFGESKRQEGTQSRRGRIALLSYIANLEYGRALDGLHSRLQADLPRYGSRLQASCPPISDWAYSVRQHSRVRSLTEYVESGTLSAWHAAAIDVAIASEESITIGGSVNSGKTTLLNAVIDRAADHNSARRMVAVQDRRELRLDRFGDRLYLMARVRQAVHGVGYTYEFSDALEDLLRYNGDGAVWGEVRDPLSAFGLVLALNTGTKGLCTTIHCSSAANVPERYGALLELGGHPAVPALLANVADLLVYMERDPRTGLRRVKEVARLCALVDGAGYRVDYIPAHPGDAVPSPKVVRG